MAKAYFIRKPHFDTKAALLHPPACTGLLWSSWQKGMKLIPLHTALPTPEWTTAFVAQLILPQDAHELLHPREASVRSEYSCSINPLQYGRAIFP